ncbi:YciI family protein [Micromonospora sp. NPDC050495]|uniref:YciI family protein n=1 Tax=Micromonospora sp. NPDC050495 TaxID=3154936 RepID=UPI0033F3174D
MDRYLVMTKFVPGHGPADGSPEHAEEMRAWDRFNRELATSGRLVQSFGLDLPAGNLPAKRPGGDDGELVFAQYVIEADSLADVEQWARQMPVLKYGSVEIRRVLFEDAP